MKLGRTIVFRDKLFTALISIYLIIFWKFLPKKKEKFAVFEVEYALIPKILFLIPRILQEILVREMEGLTGASVIFRGKPFIYIPSDAPIRYRRFLVFHEWLEWKQLLDWSKGKDLPDEKEIVRHMKYFGKASASIMAHNYALVGEEKLAKGELSEKEFLNFSRWKKSRTKKRK